jgi:hypothetical protein
MKNSIAGRNVAVKSVSFSDDSMIATFPIGDRVSV